MYSILSTSVVFPWSTCAIIAMFLIFCIVYDCTLIFHGGRGRLACGNYKLSKSGQSYCFFLTYARKIVKIIKIPPRNAFLRACRTSRSATSPISDLPIIVQISQKSPQKHALDFDKIIPNQPLNYPKFSPKRSRDAIGTLSEHYRNITVT